VPDDLDPNTDLLTLAEYEKVFGEPFDAKAYARDFSSECAQP